MVVSSQRGDRIYQLYQQGKSTTQLALVYDCSEKEIIRILREWGVCFGNSKKAMTERELQANRIEEFFQLYQSGLTQRQIGDQLGISHTRVGQLLKMHPHYAEFRRLRQCLRSKNSRVSRSKAKREWKLATHSLLAVNGPEIIRYWDDEKMGKLSPSDVLANAKKKIWLKCPDCGHSWQTSANYITSSWKKNINSKGCKKCLPKLMKGFFSNRGRGRHPSFATAFPELVEQYWDDAQSPHSVTLKSALIIELYCTKHKLKLAKKAYNLSPLWDKGKTGCKLCDKTTKEKAQANA